MAISKYIISFDCTQSWMVKHWDGRSTRPVGASDPRLLSREMGLHPRRQERQIPHASDNAAAEFAAQGLAVAASDELALCHAASLAREYSDVHG